MIELNKEVEKTLPKEIRCIRDFVKQEKINNPQDA